MSKEFLLLCELNNKFNHFKVAARVSARESMPRAKKRQMCDLLVRSHLKQENLPSASSSLYACFQFIKSKQSFHASEAAC